MEEYETNCDSSTPSSSNDAPELERSEDYLSFVVDKFLLSSNNSNERSSAVTSQNVDMLTSLRASLKDGFDKYSFSRNANSDDIEDLEEVENDEAGAQWDCETILCECNEPFFSFPKCTLQLHIPILKIDLMR